MSPKQFVSETKIVASLLSKPEDIRSAFDANGNAAEAIAARTAYVDRVVARAYHDFLAPAMPTGIALLAVGGYGRRELFPHSDIDLLLLVDREIQAESKRNALSAFLRTLWDAGMRLSQSVRTVGECCALDTNNVELSVSLIDQRFLTGDAALYEELSTKLPRFFERQKRDLILHLCDLSRRRHAKFHDTIYHLEPNIKETPGAMRDLHLVHWIAALRNASDDSLQALTGAREFLSALRCRLHYKFGRDNNVLTFETQDELAPNPEKWMREYYHYAREIHRAAVRQMDAGEALGEGGLFQSFQDWRTRLSNADFSVTRERVYFKSPQQIQADPDLVIRLFQFVGRHGIRLSLEAERRVREHLKMLTEHYSYRRPLWAQLHEILIAPHAALAVRSMHETGMLLAVLPEWREIDSLVVRDFYHRYTVDEHTLITLEAIEELRASTDPMRRRFQDLLAEIEDPAVLSIALMFHDAGKSEGLEGHSERSVRLAERAFERIEMPPETQRHALLLIERHLALSTVMNARDPSDPATARDLAARVNTIEDLKYLTVLTYADISAVNPEAMTPWRLEQLWRVYVLGFKELTRELDTERIHPDKQSFIEGFPTRYLLTHSDADIRWHSELEQLSRAAGVAVDVRRHDESYRLIVITKDRPNLFASLAGTLSSFGMNILKAEAFANQSGMVLDTFSFDDPMRTLELNPAEMDRLKFTIQRAALGKEDVKRLLKGRPKTAAPVKSAQVQPTVSFDSEASSAATLVEIVAEDRPGLLFDIAEKFSSHNCSIDVVLIDTRAHKALDVFYVTSGGKKLTGELQTELKAELLQVL
jgi:[protein-PII] uridylyltransferase